MPEAAASAQAKLQEFESKCCSCGIGCSIDDSTPVRGDCRRCKRCGALRSRVTRLLAVNEKLRESWEGCGEEQKKQFLTNPDNQALFAGDLKKQLEVTVSESHKLSSSTKFKGIDKFKDEADIIEKYKSKPEQAASILKNADSFVCPNRGVKLYADIEYEGAREQVEEHAQEKKRQLSQDQTIKPPKKPTNKKSKTDAGAAEAGEAASENHAEGKGKQAKAKPWTDKDTTKTDKVKKDLQEITAEMEVLLEENDTTGKAVQGAVLTAAQKIVADTNAAIAELQLKAGNKNTEGLPDLVVAWMLTLKKAKSTKKLLKDQLDFMRSIDES